MKHLFTLPLLLAMFFTFDARAQQEEKSNHIVYCTISPSHNLFANKIKVNVDYGQQNTHLLQNDKLKDPDTGVELQFKSIIDALNYMNSQGWDFVQTYVEVSDGESSTYWLLRMELNNEAVPVPD